jgi:hypothetical protein
MKKIIYDVVTKYNPNQNQWSKITS